MGIDPGLSRCGYGVVRRGPGGVPVAAAAGVVETGPELEIHRRLFELQGELRALVAEHRPSVVVVERVFFQVNVRTAMSVGQASGLALAAAAAAGCEVVQYTANEVKQAVVEHRYHHLIAGLYDTPEPAAAASNRKGSAAAGTLLAVAAGVAVALLIRLAVR